MNLVVLAEGPSEVGKFWNSRNPLDIIPDSKLGALEIIAKRIATAVCSGEAVDVVAFPRLPVRRSGHTQRASLTNVLKDSKLLKMVLTTCLTRAQSERQAKAADLAIVACDSDLAEVVGRAVAAVEPCCGPKRLLHVIFDPEFEVVLHEKKALNAVTGRDVSLLAPGDPEYGSKEALKRSLRAAGYPGAVDSDFYGAVARQLSLDHLKGQPAIARAIEAWNKKGRRIAAG